MRIGVAATLACLLAATVIPCPAPAEAQAQSEARTLAVSPTEMWRHAATGMNLPSEVTGLTRTSIRDNSDAELDVFATYANREEGVFALVYLYRTMTPSVPLWFDRALATITLPQQGAAAPVVAPFTRPGASAATGLRTATTDPNPRLTSTALAIAPLGTNWLVKIRLGSNRLDPAALDQRLSAFVAALPWPAETGTAHAAVPILPCATPLQLRRAQVVANRVEDSLIDSVAGSMSLEHETAPPAYCREPGATIERGVYRPDSATDAYLIALNDAGIALDVGQMTDVSDLLGEGHGRPRYGVTLLDRNSFRAYPSFNRLPPPDQVLETVRNGPGPFTTTAAPGRGNR